MKSTIFNQLTSLKPLEALMPVFFMGHGSPMNGIEDNEFSLTWKRTAVEIPTPKAVLVISAHWLTRGTRITAMEFPRTIHDFRGFPPALSEVRYPAPGSPAIASEAASLIKSAHVVEDHDWGLDHGAWTVIRHMYPNADIPVLQMSIDYTQSPDYHYRIASELYEIRKKGVLILGSGNMVHNLRMLSWDMIEGGGYDWAININHTFKNLILNNEHEKLVGYEKLGKEAAMAIPTPEHYIPLLYTLGLRSAKDAVSFFNDKAVGGSLTMTSVKISSD